MLPLGAASTKCCDGRGASVSDASTILTVNAGPATRTLLSAGETISMSGI